MASVRRALSTAWLVILADCAICRAISAIDDDSSSAAAGDGLHACRWPRWRRIADDAGLLIGTVGGAAHRLRGGFEFGRAGRHQSDQLTDRGVEFVGERDQRVALLGFAALLQRGLFAPAVSAPSSRSAAAGPASRPSGRFRRRDRFRRPSSSSAPSAMLFIRACWRCSAPSTSLAISQDSNAISARTPAPMPPSRSSRALMSASRSST